MFFFVMKAPLIMVLFVMMSKVSIKFMRFLYHDTVLSHNASCDFEHGVTSHRQSLDSAQQPSKISL